MTLGALMRGARAMQHAVEDWHTFNGARGGQRVRLAVDIDEHVGLIVRSSSTGAVRLEWLLDGVRVAEGTSEDRHAGAAWLADLERQGRY